MAMFDILRDELQSRAAIFYWHDSEASYLLGIVFFHIGLAIQGTVDAMYHLLVHTHKC